MLRLPLCAMLILSCGWASGCASTAPGPANAPDRAAALPEADVEFDAVPAAALVFDPPVARQEPPLQLSRQGRATEAFVGYEQGIVEYHYVRVDDRQRTGAGWDRGFGVGWGAWGDRYERRAVSERFGVRYR
jgi:hypothetical protein